MQNLRLELLQTHSRMKGKCKFQSRHSSKAQTPHERPVTVTVILQVPGIVAVPAIQGPVYVKYNAASLTSYVSSYDGRDRGVLITFGQIQVGHLPLGLFSMDAE